MAGFPAPELVALPGSNGVPAFRQPPGDTWGFALYRASHDDYQDSLVPNGHASRQPEEALDCAYGFYLNDPTTWLPNTPTN